jgi:hypothetical protein
VRSPTPAITLIGPERVAIPGGLTTDGFLHVSHMYPNSRAASGIGVAKFDVCEGVYHQTDADLVGEIIGIRWQHGAARFAQSWTVDSFGRAGDQAKTNSKHRADQVLWDIELLQFVYNEITIDWVGVKKSDRFDVACEILRNVLGHVMLGRTDARKKVKKLLINSTELQDSLHRLNPRANSVRISAAIPRFFDQSHLDWLSEISLENARQVALLLQKQVAEFLDYLKLCMLTDTVPTRNSFNTIYKVMDIKPYSYALGYVRQQKRRKQLSGEEELILLYETLATEFRLSMVSNLCSKLKHAPMCHDSTVEEMISSALIDRNDFPVYLTTIQIVRRQWVVCKQLIASGETKKAIKALEKVQSLIRYRMAEVADDNERKLVRAADVAGHVWQVQPLEYRPPELRQPKNVFSGLPT